MNPELDTTGQLLLRCANPYATADSLQEGFESLPSWDRFIDASRNHRLLPLLHHHFSQLPDSSIPDQAAEAARIAYIANTVRTEHLTAQLANVSKLLLSSDIRAMPWKGPSLANSIYHDAALRPADDLDFLVHPDDMTRAIAVLTDAQFVPHIEMSDGTLHHYLSAGFEYIVTSPDKEVWIELAPRQLPPPFGITVHPELIWSDPEALEPELYFLLLCMHGAKHNWDRLIWVSDLCAFLKSHSDIDLEKVVQHAKEARAEVLLLAAMDLAESTGFSAPKMNIDAKRVPLEVLTNNALHSAGISVFEETRRRISIYSRKADAVRHVARWLFAPTFSDWEGVSLTPSMYFLYWILRPFRIMASAIFRRKEPS